MTDPQVKRKIGRPRGSRPAERAIKAMKIQEIINLSEHHLIRVLKGEMGVSIKDRTNVALELYKRRVPTKVETDSKQGQFTLIKIVKNHIPVHQVTTTDISTDQLEEAVDGVLHSQEPDKDRPALERSSGSS
jgi:hypothetical protein